MAKVSGTVSKLLTRPWGDKVFHSFMLEGHQKSFGTGTHKSPLVFVGNVIEFEAENNAKGFPEVVKNSIRQGEKVAATVVQTGVPATNKWQPKDPAEGKIIQLQSCRNSAIALVDVLVKNGMVKLPTKKDDQYDAVLELVAELTEDFVAENENVRQGKAFRETSEPLEVTPTVDTSGNDADAAAEEVWA